MQTPPQRQLNPFGMGHVPIDPRTGRHLPLAITSVVRRFLVVSVHDDYLRCTDEGGNEVSVAKPMMLRKTPFDGLEIDDVTYVQVDENNRTANGRPEHLFPEYMADTEYILAVQFTTGVFDPIWSQSTEPELELSLMTDSYERRVEWQDINAAGRTWVRPDGFVRVYAERDSGTAGDASNTCAFIYSLYDTDKTTLLKKNAAGDDATGMEPENKDSRLVDTKYTTPTGKNLAWAFYDDYDLALWDANEVPHPPEAC